MKKKKSDKNHLLFGFQVFCKIHTKYTLHNKIKKKRRRNLSKNLLSKLLIVHIITIKCQTKAQVTDTMYMNYKKNYNFTYLIIKLNKNEFYKNIFKYRQYFFLQK